MWPAPAWPCGVSRFAVRRSRRSGHFRAGEQAAGNFCLKRQQSAHYSPALQHGQFSAIRNEALRTPDIALALAHADFATHDAMPFDDF